MTANKQTVQATHDGVNVTWNREENAPMSAKEVGDFYVDSVRSLQRLKARDPRGMPGFKRAGAYLFVAMVFVSGWFAGNASTNPDASKPRPWRVEADGIITPPPMKSTDRDLDRDHERTEPMPEPRVARTERKQSPAALSARATNTSTSTITPASTVVLTDPQLASAKHRLSSDVFDYLLEKTRVRLGKAEPINNPDGTADVLVPVSWRVDPEPVLLALNEYFWDVSHLPLREARVDFSGHLDGKAVGTIVTRHENWRQNRKVPYAEPLLDWLSSWQLRAVITMGKHSSYVTLATGRSCWVSCKGVGRDQYQLQFNHDANDKTLLMSNVHAEQDPVVLANVPATDLDQVGNVEARLEWTKLP